jgi:hypothetical protein
MDLQGSRIIKRYTKVRESKTLLLGKLLVLNTNEEMANTN